MEIFNGVGAMFGVVGATMAPPRRIRLLCDKIGEALRGRSEDEWPWLIKLWVVAACPGSIAGLHFAIECVASSPEGISGHPFQLLFSFLVFSYLLSGAVVIFVVYYFIFPLKFVVSVIGHKHSRIYGW